jgi:hypothetical protein
MPGGLPSTRKFRVRKLACALAVFLKRQQAAASPKKPLFSMQFSYAFSAPNEHENLNSAAISAFGVAVAIGKRFFRIAISNPDPDSDSDSDGLSFLLFSE